MTNATEEAKNILDVIAEIAGYHFKNRTVLDTALRHKSVLGKPNYERLEFFGDRILGIIVSEQLYAQFPEADQGELTARFHALTHEGYLASIAQKCQLTQFIEHQGADDIANKNSVQGDIVESVIAALYLDGGMQAARSFILSQWQFDEMMPDSLEQNPKSTLQEWAAAHKYGLPEYQTIDKTGTEHEPVFTVSVSVKGFPSQQAEGNNIKAAERNAARLFLEKNNH